MYNSHEHALVCSSRKRFNLISCNILVLDETLSSEAFQSNESNKLKSLRSRVRKRETACLASAVRVIKLWPIVSGICERVLLIGSVVARAPTKWVDLRQFPMAREQSLATFSSFHQNSRTIPKHEACMRSFYVPQCGSEIIDILSSGCGLVGLVSST